MNNGEFDHDGLFDGWDDGGPTSPDNLSTRAVFIVKCGKSLEELGRAIAILGRALDGSPPEEQLLAVEDIYDTGRQAADKVSDMLTFTKAEASLIRKALGMSQP